MAALTLLPQFTRAAPGADSPLRIAVAGTGRQGRAILGQLQKLEAADVVAICDTDERRLASAARRAPGAAQFRDHRALLDNGRDLQAVIVATPTDRHRQVAVDALAAGHHVYCEAPLASTIDDARAIVRAARESNAVFQAGLQARSNPIYKLARTFYRSDAVRNLVSMRAQHHRKTTWRTPASDPQRDRELNWRLDFGPAARSRAQLAPGSGPIDRARRGARHPPVRRHSLVHGPLPHVRPRQRQCPAVR
jgi:predicted dehydrogenase